MRVQFRHMSSDYSQVVLQHVLDQINSADARRELQDMQPSNIQWHAQVKQTAERLVPFFCAKAKQITSDIEQRLNAPVVALQLAQEPWLDAISTSPTYKRKLETLRDSLKLAAEYTYNLKSQQVSSELASVITRLARSSDLPITENSGSLYPDFYFINYDYASLPLHKKGKKIEGPNRRKDGKPSNIPDGFELKTNEIKSKKSPKVKVDAHGSHSGLHLAVSWAGNKSRAFEIVGFWIAYIRKSDYKHSNRNVESTTDKYSFGHKLFISLIPQQSTSRELTL